LIGNNPVQMDVELITLKGQYHFGMTDTSTGIIEPLLDSMVFMQIFAEQGKRNLFRAWGL
jgi:hypothetical protein